MSIRPLETNQWNFNQNMKLFIHEYASENIVCEMAAMFSWGRWVKQNMIKIGFPARNGPAS